MGDGGPIANPTIKLDPSATATVEILAGQSLLIEVDAIARIYDARGSQVKAGPLKSGRPQVQPGRSRLHFDGEFQGVTPPKVVVNLKTGPRPRGSGGRNRGRPLPRPDPTGPGGRSRDQPTDSRPAGQPLQTLPESKVARLHLRQRGHREKPVLFL